MKLSNFKSGVFRMGDQYRYFLPEFINHSFDIDNAEIVSLIETASLKLGELNSFARFVPNIDLFIHSLVAKEAVTSSAIEGTQTNIEEALTDKTDIDPDHRNDWLEVQRYIEAMNTSVSDLSHLPLSSRLIKKAHKILLTGVRGKHKAPGEFRKSQNWIGGATLKDALYIPPHHNYLPDLMSDLEKFLHNDRIEVSHLIKIGIVHYQFETIHPFLDGNGRIGRLLITLYLVSFNLLEKPLLYLSDFFEKNRTHYYDNLTRTREKHDLNHWLKFFLVGVIETSTKSINVLQRILALKEELTQDKLSTLGRKFGTAQVLLDSIFKSPVVTSKKVQSLTQLSPKASNELIADFIKLDILNELNDKKRDRVFFFKDYLDILRS